MENASELNSKVATSISSPDSKNPPAPVAEETLWFSLPPLTSLTRVEESECSAEMRTILREFLADECLLTTRNQNTLCCYWDITPDCISKTASQKRVDEEWREAIRLTWPPQSLFDFNFQILPVPFASRHVYLSVPFPGKPYRVEVGWICKDGDFISILESNPSTIR